LMVNSEFGGNGWGQTRGEDDVYYYDTLAMQSAYQAGGGHPDQIVVISWYEHPSAMLPPSQPFTFTFDYHAVVSGPPPSPVAPVYELTGPGGPHFYTASPDEKNASVVGQHFSLLDIGFYAWGSQVPGTDAVMRLSDPFTGAFLYTTSATEASNAQAQGWNL